MSSVHRSGVPSERVVAIRNMQHDWSPCTWASCLQAYYPARFSCSVDRQLATSVLWPATAALLVSESGKETQAKCALGAPTQEALATASPSTAGWRLSTAKPHLLATAARPRCKAKPLQGQHTTYMARMPYPKRCTYSCPNENYRAILLNALTLPWETSCRTCSARHLASGPSNDPHHRPT